MTSASRASQRWLLPLLLLLAALHATSSALIHPLYQVSDELNYVASAQRSGLAQASNRALASCVSPPDGRTPDVLGGKVLFHKVAGMALTSACRAGAGTRASVLIRIAFGLGLVVVTWCGWHAARLLGSGTLVAALTALVLGTQHVLAKYSAAISPDSLANACAAVAILQMLRWLVLGPSAPRLVGLVAATIGAAAFKDTALALLPVHALAVFAVGLARFRTRSDRRLAATFGAAVAVAAVVAVSPFIPPASDLGSSVAGAIRAPLVFGGLVVADTVTRLPGLLGSAYSSLGGFGGTSAALPASGTVAAAGLWLAAVAGHLVPRAVQPCLPPWVTAYFLALAGSCLIQAPVRQVLLGTNEQHQGRWLFPVAVPLSIIAARGLARLNGARTWPLATVASLTLALSSMLTVVQFHVTSPAWSLAPASLYVHSTGGLDVGAASVARQVRLYWAATAPPGPAIFALLSCLLCGALLLRCRPVSGTPHVHHADHR